VLLAYAPEAVLHDLLRTGLRKFTRNTPDAATLLRQLAEIRQRGYAMTDSEIDPDATAVAVPVQWGDMVVCGLSVAGPAFRFTPARQRKALMLLRRAARQLRGVLDSRAARRRRLRNIAVQEV
jgi:DNA-binding IclR family transcriptional regulator